MTTWGLLWSSLLGSARVNYPRGLLPQTNIAWSVAVKTSQRWVIHPFTRCPDVAVERSDSFEDTTQLRTAILIRKRDSSVALVHEGETCAVQVSFHSTFYSWNVFSIATEHARIVQDLWKPPHARVAWFSWNCCRRACIQFRQWSRPIFFCSSKFCDASSGQILCTKCSFNRTSKANGWEYDLSQTKVGTPDLLSGLRQSEKAQFLIKSWNRDNELAIGSWFCLTSCDTFERRSIFWSHRWRNHLLLTDESIPELDSILSRNKDTMSCSLPNMNHCSWGSGLKQWGCVENDEYASLFVLFWVKTNFRRFADLTRSSHAQNETCTHQNESPNGKGGSYVKYVWL